MNKNYDSKYLNKERFPRASTYDIEWMLQNEMGPNAVWLAEELTKFVEPKSGQRVLDMGCGTAITSIFYAKEFRAKVFANDLWISPDDNWTRIKEAGCEDSVFPIRAEARSLPYAKGFFDLILSVDAYQYFGTDDLYLGYMNRFLADGGRMGLLMPAITQEFDKVPEHLSRMRKSGTPFWDPSECWCFHTLDWWKRHLERTGLVTVEEARYVEDGWRLWYDWEMIRDGKGNTGFPSEAETLLEDAGRYIGFVLLVVEKLPAPDTRFDHSLMIRL